MLTWLRVSVRVCRLDRPTEHNIRVPMLGGARYLRRDLGAVAVNVGAPIFFAQSPDWVCPL